MTQPEQGAGGAPPEGQGPPAGTGPVAGTGTGGTDPIPAPVVPAGVPVEEAEALRARMQAADRRASALEKQLGEIRDKDLPELEKLKRDFAESAAAREKLTADLQSARIEAAFLQDNTYTWHDSAAALALADMSKVDIDESGKVIGLKAALDALAKSSPWLIKKEDSEGEKDKDDPPPPGAPPVNGGQSGGQASSVAALKSRWPALRTKLG